MEIKVADQPNSDGEDSLAREGILDEAIAREGIAKVFVSSRAIKTAS
jgi:hypothetical protein